MHALQSLMPLVSACALALALLVPLRDGRRGRRATVPGHAIVTASFPMVPSEPFEPATDVDVNVTSAAGEAAPIRGLARFLDGRVSAFLATTLRGSIFDASGRAPAPDADAGAAESMASPEHGTDDLVDARRFAEAIAAYETATPCDAGEPAVLDDDRQRETDGGRESQERTPDDVAPEQVVSDDSPSESDRIACEPDPIDDELTRRAAIDERPARTHRTWSVPPTRMPLRPLTTPQWPQLLPVPLGETSRERRHAVLARRFTGDDGAYEPALCAAFAQEDPRGRILVLRALGAFAGERSQAILAHALHDGTDDERSTALDSLAARGERHVLAGALTDRVDAIAARAALAFVGSGDRAEYERVLEPLVDRARLETLLGLLAAVLV